MKNQTMWTAGFLLAVLLAEAVSAVRPVQVKLKAQSPRDPLQLILKTGLHEATLDVYPTSSFSFYHNNRELLSYDKPHDTMTSKYDLVVKKDLRIE